MLSDIVASTLDNKELCARLKERGREYAMKRTWKSQALKFLRLYGELLGDGNRMAGTTANGKGSL